MKPQLIKGIDAKLIQNAKEQHKTADQYRMAAGYELLNKKKTKRNEKILNRKTMISIVIAAILTLLLTLGGIVTHQMGMLLLMGVIAYTGVMYAIKNHPLYSVVLLLLICSQVFGQMRFNF